uniref:Uncharacterized protein n=1 Tax=Mycobacterium sp. (strain MCS) TaxID=164756 RepID=A0A5Q5BRG7_MYCSS
MWRLRSSSLRGATDGGGLRADDHTRGPRLAVVPHPPAPQPHVPHLLRGEARVRVVAAERACQHLRVGHAEPGAGGSADQRPPRVLAAFTTEQRGHLRPGRDVADGPRRRRRRGVEAPVVHDEPQRNRESHPLRRAGGEDHDVGVLERRADRRGGQLGQRAGGRRGTPLRRLCVRVVTQRAVIPRDGPAGRHPVGVVTGGRRHTPHGQRAQPEPLRAVIGDDDDVAAGQIRGARRNRDDTWRRGGVSALECGSHRHQHDVAVDDGGQGGTRRGRRQVGHRARRHVAGDHIREGQIGIKPCLRWTR